MRRKVKRWLLSLWRGWEYRRVGGQWALVTTRPLSKRAWVAARKDAEVAIPTMEATEELFRRVTLGRTSFAALAASRTNDGTA